MPDIRLMASTALVLNATYEPLCVVSVRRATILVLSAKARALMKGRYHVTFDDVRALYTPVLRHRILLNFHAESDRLKQDDILRRVLEAMPAPRE